MRLSRFATILVVLGFFLIVAVIGANSWRTYQLEQETHAVGDTVNPKGGPWAHLYDYLAGNNSMLRDLLVDRGIATPTYFIPPDPTPVPEENE